MSWGMDPELQAMFYGELDERAARLREGSAELQAGPVPSDRAGVMMREAHTIKGTGRVLGFDAVAHVGEFLEELWRRMQSGDLELSRQAAAAMGSVTAVLAEAGRGDPATGTPELVQTFNAFVAETPLEFAPLGPAVVPGDEVADGVEMDPAVETVSGPAPAADEAVTPEAQPQPVVEQTPGVEPEPELQPQPEPEPVPEPQPEPESQPVPESQPELEPEPVPQPEPTDETVRPAGEQSPAAADEAMVGADRPPSETDGGTEDVRHYRVDLAGLMGAVEHWARNETVMVNAGRLHEMVNEVAAMRRHAAAALAEIDLAAAAEGSTQDATQLHETVARLQAEAESLQTNALGLGAVPISGLTSQLPQLVGYLAKKLDRLVELEVEGDDDLAVDKQVLDAIGDPIRQVMVNAIHHGIEPRAVREEAGKPPKGVVTVRFSLKRGTLEVVVSDDGRGIDWDLIRSVAATEGKLDPAAPADPNLLYELLFEPGFTTGTDADFGGGGKGLSTVQTVTGSLFGEVALETKPGAGTTVTIAVPAFRALQNVLLVVAGGMEWGIPNAAVDAVLQLGDFEVETDQGRGWITWEQQRLPVVSLAESVGLKEAAGGDAQVVVLSQAKGSVALTVSTVGGVRELAVKELGRIVAGPRLVLGAAFVAGDMVLIVDAGKLIERSQKAPGELKTSARVLVVDDSRGARAVVSGALASSGFLTNVAGSVAEALEVLDEITVDALVVDFSMPQADGVALVEEVRRRGNLLPIIMLSGVANREDQDRAREAGADAFFEKADFREGVLANALWEMLDD